MSEVTALQAKIDSLAANVTALTENVAKATQPGDRSAGAVFGGAPAARRGEDPLTSRGFQYSRVVGVLNKRMDPAYAKVELEISQRLQREYVERGFFQKHEAGSVVVPFSSELMMQSDPSMDSFAQEIGQVMRHGVAGADPEEMAAIRRRQFQTVNRTLSWQDAGNMMELIPPPVFGEPIELLRNQEVFLRAGARTIPFPASGRAVWPRFTGATSASWIGSAINDREIALSEPTTGDLVLTAKKLGVRVQIPNELFRFPTVSVEQIIRADMMRSAALKMDRAFLDSVGSANEPKGLLNYSGINTFTPGEVGADGNRLKPEDILQIIADVEENNIMFGAWVGRPKLYAGLGNKRADAVTAGDGKGMFLFNVLRDNKAVSTDATNNSVGSLEGYPYFKTNQVVKTRSKGNSSDLTYLLGGNFSEYMIAMSGVMEFALATQGTIFANDQSEIRLIAWADGAPRYEKAFILVDNLYQTA